MKCNNKECKELSQIYKNKCNVIAANSLEKCKHYKPEPPKQPDLNKLLYKWTENVSDVRYFEELNKRIKKLEEK